MLRPNFKCMKKLSVYHFTCILLFLFPVLISCSQTTTLQEEPSAETLSADVIVYGETSAAVTAAVQVPRLGKSVIMVSPDVHLGGYLPEAWDGQIPGIKK